MTFTALGRLDGDYAYLDEGTAVEFCAPGEMPGWYDADGALNYDPTPKGEDKIPFGKGVIVLSDCGAKITSAGEVIAGKAGEFTFDILSQSEGGNSYLGNCSPVNRQLKDFSVTSPAGGLTSAISVHLMTFTPLGRLDGDYAYLDEGTAVEFCAPDEMPGWYDADGALNYDPTPKGEDPINAGQMFIILSDCGAKITVPSALD